MGLVQCLTLCNVPSVEEEVNMPRRLLIVAGLLALLLAVFALTGNRSQTASADVALDSEEQAFVTLINNWRAQNGAGPLTVNTSISGAAEWMNNDMGQNHYFSHTDSLGRAPWDRMCVYGYCYNTWMGENIAAGYTTGQSVFDAWKNSAGHNTNMLNANYKVMGLSRLYVAGSDYGWYWTNDFGGYVPPSQPAAPTATPTPAPTATPAPTPPPTSAPTAAPTPTVPAGFGCPGDFDCDTWPDAVETSVGTSPNQKCNATFTRNDETDALPADFNDDRWINGSDLLSFNTKFGSSAVRWDLNLDGTVNGADVLALNPVMLKKC